MLRLVSAHFRECRERRYIDLSAIINIPKYYGIYIYMLELRLSCSATTASWFVDNVQAISLSRTKFFSFFFSFFLFFPPHYCQGTYWSTYKSVIARKQRKSHPTESSQGILNVSCHLHFVFFSVQKYVHTIHSFYNPSLWFLWSQS